MNINPKAWSKRSKLIGGTAVALITIGGCSAAITPSEADGKEGGIEFPSEAVRDAGSEVAEAVPAPTTEVEEAPVTTEAAPTTTEAPATTQAPTTTAAPAPEFTASQEQALRAAEQYLEVMPFSRQGLIDQLSSEYGSGFAIEDAEFAVFMINADYFAEAEEAAASYLDTMAFSCQGLIDQLSSEYGSQFTIEEATHGAQTTGLCG